MSPVPVHVAYGGAVHVACEVPVHAACEAWTAVWVGNAGTALLRTALHAAPHGGVCLV